MDNCYIPAYTLTNQHCFKLGIYWKNYGADWAVRTGTWLEVVCHL